MAFKETIKIKGDTRDVNRQLDKTNKKLSTMNSRIKSVAKAGLAFAAVYLGARGIINLVKSSVSAFIVQEKAIRMLDQAFEQNTKGLQRYASELQEVTQFGDETIISSMALIAAFVKEEDALKKATKATLDLAAAKGFELSVAADLVGKTLGSTTNALTRYGIQVEGAVGSTERLESLVTNINAVFGGMAEAMAETTEGSIQQMKNAVGDLTEVFGEALSPAIITVTENIKEAAIWLTNFFDLLAGPDVDIKGLLPDDQEIGKRFGAIQTALDDLKEGTRSAEKVMEDLNLEMGFITTERKVRLKLQEEEIRLSVELRKAQKRFREQQKKERDEQAKELIILRNEAQALFDELEAFEDLELDILGDVNPEEIAEFTQKQIDQRNLLRDTEEQIAGFLADSATSMLDAAASGQNVLNVLVDSAKQLLLMIARAKIFAAIQKATGAGLGAATGGIGAIAKAILGFHQGGLVKMHSGGFMNDEVLSVLRRGEFVIRNEAVNNVGIGTLNRINQTGQVPQDFGKLEKQLIVLNRNVKNLDRRVTIISEIDGLEFVETTVNPAQRNISRRSWE